MSAGSKSASREDVYEWWSRHPGALDVLYTVAFLGREREFREESLERLDLDTGERVLEIGCGTGNSLRALRQSVGPDGTVVGLDPSRGMTRVAHDRIRRSQWENASVLQADARHPPIRGQSMDAAYAAMSLSAVANLTKAVQSIKRVLRPSGRFVVLDARPFQDFPWTLLNPVVTPVAKRTTNWVTEIDFVAALRREFERVKVTSYNGGSIVIVRAEG